MKRSEQMLPDKIKHSWTRDKIKTQHKACMKPLCKEMKPMWSRFVTKTRKHENNLHTTPVIQVYSIFTQGFNNEKETFLNKSWQTTLRKNRDWHAVTSIVTRYSSRLWSLLTRLSVHFFSKISQTFNVPFTSRVLESSLTVAIIYIAMKPNKNPPAKCQPEHWVLRRKKFIYSLSHVSGFTFIWDSAW